VTIIYGSTEAGVIAFAACDVIADTPNAVGHVPPWVELEIVDEKGAVLPPGEEGFIRCRTPVYVKNFAANNPDTRVDARNAWWYPGDLGRCTKDGTLCVSGRSGDVINRGGSKVSAAVLEDVVLSYPAVKDAGICGIMGDSGITELWIAVVPKTMIDTAMLKQDLEADDAFNSGIDGIVIVDGIPRNELGKIKRHELRETLVGMKKGAS
jgi:acyl-coenzyme A synthetase/AMP-(fatty) acid ligase